MRIEIHVRPGASGTKVGGEHGGVLVVRVAERAEGGKATSAALKAVADAVEVPRGSVSLVRGATSRRKLIEITTDLVEDARVERVVERLRTECPPRSPNRARA